MVQHGLAAWTQSVPCDPGAVDIVVGMARFQSPHYCLLNSRGKTKTDDKECLSEMSIVVSQTRMDTREFRVQLYLNHNPKTK